MNRINLSALVLCVALCTGAAVAGSKYTGDGHVSIFKNADGTGSASGYLGMIYNRPDNEWIGCQKSSTNVVFCTCHEHGSSDRRLLGNLGVPGECRLVDLCGRARGISL